MDGSTMALDPFDISSIDGGTVVAIGMRCVWRSHIAKPLLYHNRDKYNIGVVISPTEPVNPFYKRFCKAPRAGH